VFIGPGSALSVAERLDRVLQWPHARRGLNGQQFNSLLEVEVLIEDHRGPSRSIEDWRIDYNLNRPHSAHGWLSPVELVEAWRHRQQQPQLS
jgi:putative transposase